MKDKDEIKDVMKIYILDYTRWKNVPLISLVIFQLIRLKECIAMRLIGSSSNTLWPPRYRVNVIIIIKTVYLSDRFLKVFLP